MPQYLLWNLLFLKQYSSNNVSSNIVGISVKKNLLTTWLTLLEILSMVRHTHWQYDLAETPTMFEDTSSLLYCFRNRRIQSRYWGLYMTCNLWINSFDTKKEDNPKWDPKSTFCNRFTYFLGNLCNIFKLKWQYFHLKSCQLKVKVELHESVGNCLMKSFFLNWWRKVVRYLHIYTDPIDWNPVVSFYFTLICWYR